ncbi:MAG: hypothetical protein IJY52_00870 [Anaerotignum sp.]|nr:hypothetical protein [Anaerotignum sp.]
MTEQERRRRRRERQMRAKAGMRKKRERKGGLTAFRIYVTTILVGGCLLVSLFHTETSEMVCGKVKEVIAMQISGEELAEWKSRAAAYFREKEIALPAFEEKEPQEEKKVYRPDAEP